MSYKYKLYTQDLNFEELNNGDTMSQAFKQNMFEIYREPFIDGIPKAYDLSDNFGHSLNNRLITKTDVIYIDNSNLNQDVTILYSFKDYDRVFINLYKNIEIHKGPFIEIRGGLTEFSNNFKYNNPFTKQIILDISSNISNSFLLDNIEVYIYGENSNEKYYLPYSLTLSGNYTNNDYTDISINNDFLNYNNIQTSEQEKRFIFNNKFYYISNNIKFNYTLIDNQVSTNGFQLHNIQNINYYNILSNLSLTSDQIEILQITNLIKYNNNTLTLDGNLTIIDNIVNEISNNLNIITIEHSYLDVVKNKTYVLTSKIYINNYNFSLIICPTINSIVISDITISGNFNSLKLFGSEADNLINTQYIGNYELTINVNGLSISDNIYHDLSVNLTNVDLRSLITDFSKSYNIKIKNEQNIRPTIQFKNTLVPINENIYNYKYPINTRFYLDYSLNSTTISNSLYVINTNNIDYITRQKFIEIDTKPIIEFSDNSIYDINYLSISITNSGGSINNDSDSNYIIGNTIGTYVVLDITAYNSKNIISESLTLNISFQDISLLEILGDNIEKININQDISYIDPGIKVGDIVINDISIPNIHSGNIFNNNQTVYGISYSSNIDFSNVGLYDISFIVNYPGSSITNSIRRKILLNKNPPFFVLPETRDNFIDLSNEIENSIWYNISNGQTEISSGSFDTIYNNFDFSLSYKTSFDDLSIILNTVTLSDDILTQQNLQLTIDFKIYNSSDNYINFNQQNFSLYLDNSKNINKIEKFNFKYKIQDICDNYSLLQNNLNLLGNTGDFIRVFEFSRNVLILDKESPNIIFNNITNQHIELHYDEISFQDISYTAINITDLSYNRNLLINDLSNILFNFTLTDNFFIDSSNFIINISKNSEQILSIDNNNININDNINTISNEFSIIGNVLDLSYIIFDNSDNNYKNYKNYKNINRRLEIVSTRSDFSFITPNNITISFGDISYDFNLDFSITSTRLVIGESQDISFDLSYELPYIQSTPERYTFGAIQENSISGLVYDNYYNGSYTVSFFYYSSIYNISTGTSAINVDICNFGPIITMPDTVSSDFIFYTNDSNVINDICFTSKLNIQSPYNDFINSKSVNISEISLNISYGDLSINNIQPGNYTISFTATDFSGVSNTLSKNIKIIDNKNPFINIDDISYYLNQIITISGEFKDVHSDLSYIRIIYDNSLVTNDSSINFIDNSNYNRLVNDNNSIIEISFINLKNIRFNQDISLNTNIGNVYNISFELYDIYDNSINLFKTIYINRENIIVNPFIIYDDSLIRIDNSINENFIYQFPELSNNIKYFDVSNINNTTTLTYEVNNILNTEKLDLSFQFNIDISLINYTRGNDIVWNITEENQSIIVNYYDNNLPKNYNFLLLIKDTRIPNISFIITEDYLNPNDIILPLISDDVYTSISNNINIINSNYSYLSNDYTRENRSIFVEKYNTPNVIYNIPEINIVDNLFSAKLLNNEKIDNNYFTFDISVEKIDNGTIITEFSGINATTLMIKDIYNGSINDTIVKKYRINYKINDQKGLSAYLSRNITIKAVNPYVDLNSVLINNYKYIKYYHQLNTHYLDKLGKAADYYEGEFPVGQIDVDYTNLNTYVKSINNSVKLEIDVTSITNPRTGRTVRPIHVVDIKSIYCLRKDLTYTNVLDKISNDINCTKLGINKGSYSFKIDNSNNAIRVFGYDYYTNNNKFIDISNKISITGNPFYIIPDFSILNQTTQNVPNDLSFVYGDFSLNIVDDFDRATIEFISGDNLYKIPDLLLYHKNFEELSLNNFNTDFEQIFHVSIRSENNENIGFEISGINNSIHSISGDFHFQIGKYRFQQSTWSNFFSPIQFSTVPDGIHVNGVEYTKNVTKYGLAGFYGERITETELIITASTPSPLYYYSKTFRNMGGKIETKNNIVFEKNNVYLVGNVTHSSNNSNVFQNNNDYQNLDLSNNVFLSHRVTNNSIDKHIIGITQANLVNNIIFDNSENKIFFIDVSNHPKKIAGSNTRENYRLSSNLMQKNYLFDINIDNNNSYILYVNDISAGDAICNVNNDYFFTKENIKFFHRNLLDIIYNNNEINNYSNYFRKNNIGYKWDNFYEKIPLLRNDFLSKLNDMFFLSDTNNLNKNILPYNGEKLYDFANNTNPTNPELLQSSLLKIKKDELIANRLFIDYQIGLDISKMNIYSNNSYYSNTFNRYNNNINNGFENINNSLFFSNFIITLNYETAISSEIIQTQSQNIIFSKGILELSGVFLDTSNDLSSVFGINLQESKNKIILSCFSNNEAVIGLTQQNIYHNIIVDPIGSKFIFHRYSNDNSNNQYYTSKPTDTSDMIITKSNYSHNSNFLLDICSDDIYNCFIDSNNNNNRYFYFNKPNTSTTISNNSLLLTYFIEDELAYDNSDIINTNIIPLSINNITAQDNNTYLDLSYNSILSNLSTRDVRHTHSYMIDFDKLIDVRDFKNNNINDPNSLKKIPYQLINRNRISYDIETIKNDTPFNLYEINRYTNDNLEIITSLNDLHSLQNIQTNILISNLKINYYLSISSNLFSTRNILYSYNILTGDQYQDNLFKYIILSDKIFYSDITLSGEYLNNLSVINNSLNKLNYDNQNNINSLFQNLITLKNNYVDLSNIINFENTNIFNSRDRTNIIINNINTILIEPSNNSDFSNINYIGFSTLSFEHISIIRNLLINYNNFSIQYQRIFNNLSKRHEGNINDNVYSILDDQTLGYQDIFTQLVSNDIKKLITNIIENYKNLYTKLVDDITKSQFYITISGYSNIPISIPKISDIPIDLPSNDISLIEYINNINNNDTIHYLSTNITGLENSIDNFYKSGVGSLPIDLKYKILNRNKLLINSFTSNNIQLLIKVKYDSYYYQDIELDSLLFDIQIPDIMPPIGKISDELKNIIDNGGEIIQASLNQYITLYDVNTSNKNLRVGLSYNLIPNSNNPQRLQYILKDIAGNINTLTLELKDVKLADDTSEIILIDKFCCYYTKGFTPGANYAINNQLDIQLANKMSSDNTNVKRKAKLLQNSRFIR